MKLLYRFFPKLSLSIYTRVPKNVAMHSGDPVSGYVEKSENQAI